MTQTSRRDFMQRAAAGALLAGAGLPGVPLLAEESRRAAFGKAARQPNIVIYVADEFRADFIGASGLNPTTRTPNLDKIAQRGVNWTHAITNQPLCSPSRACMLSGRYATETGMWKLPPGVEFRKDLPTLASALREGGYTANFVGKWHLAPVDRSRRETFGFVPREDRGGFLDFWEGANVLEATSRPYDGTIWDGEGKPIHFKDQYRVDFITDRAVRFLKQPQEKPFLLFISQLEPHFQNTMDEVVAPKGYAERFQNPFVPPDLLRLPGVWQQQLPDYYGCVQKIDESVGRILETLEEQSVLDNTIFLFTSDHGCHFKTRENNYKRTPHDSSIRIPFLMQGPELNQSLRLDQVVGNVDMTPTLLDLVRVPVPQSMKGKSLVPLVREPEARQQWKNEQLVQISQMNGTGMGRAIRTAEWTYCVANGTGGGTAPSASTYEEYVMYDNFADPAQMVNLVGRAPFKEQTAQLREQLLNLIVKSGEQKPEIIPSRLYR